MSIEQPIIPFWVAVDPSEESEGSTCHAVIYRIIDRWKLHDFWVVNFKAFILDANVRISDSIICGSGREAYGVKRGDIIRVQLITDEPDPDEELPF
ncbi:hypothetical protein [Obesumbacterium proteus]|uniref:hypothetical protein n=1 Tax=Obesumbacterium proteus TaxID=82983 RepID=UPI00242B742D|nr:hypothetical protein [Obesumbacterium proteus]